MKKILHLTLIAAVLSGAMVSCKKGENDPFLSLRSRKARVAGEWTVTAFESKSMTVDNGSNSTLTTTATYNGSAETSVETISVGGASTTETTVSSYTMSLDIDKDGTYELTQSGTDGTYTEKGTWLFVGKSKENELKNKEAIMLVTESESSTGYNTTYTGLDGRIFVIDQLKNKEMSLTLESSSNGSDGSTSSFSNKLTFEQK